MKASISIAIIFLIAACTTPPQQEDSISFQLDENSIIAENRASTGGISLVDIDADGDIDLYEVNGYDVRSQDRQPQGNIMYLNDGNGVFTKSSSDLNAPYGWSSGSTWADADNDGDLDVYIANQQAGNHMLVNNNGTYDTVSNLTTENIPYTYSNSWVDVDNDGLVDLYLGNGGMSAKSPNVMYRNLGKGEFERIENAATIDSTGTQGDIWADLNNDGLSDLYISDGRGADHYFLNLGNGEFEKREIVSDPNGAVFPSGSAAAADYDNDGDIDIIQSKMYGASEVLLQNDGEGNLTEMALGTLSKGGNAYGASWMDIDNDGWTDLLIWNWGSSIQFYHNLKGKLVPKEIEAFSSMWTAAGSVAFGDVNGDGRQDLVVGQWPNLRGDYEQNHLFINTSENNNHWVRINLEGTTSNRSGVGARILVETGEGENAMTQTKEVRTQHSWRSQSGIGVHFGTGTATSVKITVHWPSGKVTELENAEVDQIIRIKEE